MINSKKDKFNAKLLSSEKKLKKQEWVAGNAGKQDRAGNKRQIVADSSK